MPVLHSRLKIIFIHGAGGNGRLLVPYARMLQKYGYEVVAPDLPPFGLSHTNSVKSLEYQLWIVSHIKLSHIISLDYNDVEVDLL